MENEALHLEIQEMISEIQFLKQDAQSFFMLVGTQRNPDHIVQKLKSRIEDLEDLIFDLKQRGKTLK